MVSSRVRRPAPRRARRKLECPVCLGAALEPLRPIATSPLELDYCGRCGGVWFDAGEVPAMRGIKPDALMTAVTLRPDAFRMKCHECHASFDRNRPECPACGWKNQLSCPACRTTLSAIEHEGLRLDACPRCRGVWFDNVELAAIWNGKVAALAKRKGQQVTPGVDSDHFLLASVLWMPDPFFTGYIVASGVDAVGHAAGALAPAAGAIVENTGELAGSVFDAIGSVIASVLEALDFG